MSIAGGGAFILLGLAGLSNNAPSQAGDIFLIVLGILIIGAGLFGERLTDYLCDY